MSYRYADCVPILTGSFTGVGVGRADWKVLLVKLMLSLDQW